MLFFILRQDFLITIDLMSIFSFRKNKPKISQAVQAARLERDLNAWHFMTSKSFLKRFVIGLKIGFLEIHKYLLLTHREYEQYLDEHHGDGEVFHANRLRLREIGMHVRSTSLLWLVKRFLQVRQCYEDWEAAKKDNNFDRVVPTFTKLIDTTREQAERKAKVLHFETPYESLLDEQTPGMRVSSLERFFKELEEFCIPAYKQAKKKQKADPSFKIDPALWHMEVGMQMRIVRRLLTEIGFDFTRGKLGIGPHPICVGGRDDTRIIMRYNKDDFVMAILDTLHEGGHAMYRQKLHKEYHWHPVGNIPGQGMDEAMALIIENCIGRTPEFAKFLHKIIKEETGKKPKFTIKQLHRRLIRIEPLPLRAYADEIRYPLDLRLRYDLTKALIDDGMDVRDIPKQWKKRMKDLTGLTVKDDREGALQDIHWYIGEMGYFMNYLVGTLTAHQLYNKMCDDVPSLQEYIRSGNFSPAISWLDKNIYKKGGQHATFKLIKIASGEALNVKHYINNITQRYL